MNHGQSLRKRQLIVATSLALASCVAFADDNSMSVLTGDSYAYFNGLEYRAGKFNVPRKQPAPEQNAAAQPARIGESTKPVMPANMKPAGSEGARSTLFGKRPALGARIGPFRDDTGA